MIIRAKGGTPPPKKNKKTIATEGKEERKKTRSTLDTLYAILYSELSAPKLKS